MEKQIRVLLVEDNDSDAHLVESFLAGAEPSSPHVTRATWLKDSLSLLRDEHFDVVLLDLFLPDARDLQALEQVRAHAPEVPVVVLTVRDDEHVGLKAVQAGAQDYLVKGRTDGEGLVRSLAYAIERHHLLERLEAALAERAAAEQAHRRGEAYFRALIEKGSDIISVIEADGTLRYVSPSIERILGYAPAERIGMSAFELIHPYDLPHVRSVFAEGIRIPGLLRTLEYRIRHRDGSWCTLQSIGSNLLELPAVAAVVVNSRDITLQKAVEEERERSLSLLSATLEATADGILVVDNAGHLVSYNQQFARMWGIPELLLRADRTDELLAFARDQVTDPEYFLTRVMEMRADGEAEVSDTVAFKDGRVFERYTRPQKIGEETVGRVWSFRDITERLKIEEQFRQAQKMEAVGRLARGIAHDFNNILMAIKGTVGLLLMDVPADEPLREDL